MRASANCARARARPGGTLRKKTHVWPPVLGSDATLLGLFWAPLGLFGAASGSLVGLFWTLRGLFWPLGLVWASAEPLRGFLGGPTWRFAKAPGTNPRGASWSVSEPSGYSRNVAEPCCASPCVFGCIIVPIRLAPRGHSQIRRRDFSYVVASAKSGVASTESAHFRLELNTSRPSLMWFRPNRGYLDRNQGGFDRIRSASDQVRNDFDQCWMASTSLGAPLAVPKRWGRKAGCLLTEGRTTTQE